MPDIGPYDAPTAIKTELFATMPEKFAKSGSRPGKVVARYARLQTEVGFYLEGPAFDRRGNLYFTDVPHGRIFRMTPDGTIDLAAEYDGEPNGLKIHRDGRIFIADYRHGIVVLDPESGAIGPFGTLRPAESFKGPNDLVFASNGDLYFTDQGKTWLHDPTGRVYRLIASGSLQALIETLPGPNGLVLDPTEKILYVRLACERDLVAAAQRCAPNRTRRHLRDHDRLRYAGRHGRRRGRYRLLCSTQYGRRLGIQPDRLADLSGRILHDRQADQHCLWRPGA